MRRVLLLESHAELVGGGQLGWLDLALRLDAFAPVCACPDGGALAAAARQSGLPVAPIDLPAVRWWRGTAVLGAARRLGALLRREKIALVHANSSRAMFYAAVAARSARVPVLWHVRIAEGDGTGDRWLERRADRIAVISRAVQARFPRADAEGRVRLVYNGVDLAPFARADGQAMRAAMAWDRRPLVGMVAQLVPVKRHADFVEAAARLVGPHPDARFVVAGADPEPDRAYGRRLEQRVAEMGLADRFAFLGFCPRVPELMAALDVVVLCSEREGFGRVLVEAMAASRPVVATATGGIPEVVADGQTGSLVPVGDVEALARAIDRLLRDHERAAAMGRAGRRRAEERFGLEAHVQAVQQLYREMLGD